MLKARKSVFLCILLNETIGLKAKLKEIILIYRVIHACIEFKTQNSRSKEIIAFPFLTTQIDQSSLADRPAPN